MVLTLLEEPTVIRIILAKKFRPYRRTTRRVYLRMRRKRYFFSPPADW